MHREWFDRTEPEPRVDRSDGPVRDPLWRELEEPPVPVAAMLPTVWKLLAMLLSRRFSAMFSGIIRRTAAFKG